MISHLESIKLFERHFNHFVFCLNPSTSSHSLQAENNKTVSKSIKLIDRRVFLSENNGNCKEVDEIHVSVVVLQAYFIKNAASL